MQSLILQQCFLAIQDEHTESLISSWYVEMLGCSLYGIQHSIMMY